MCHSALTRTHALAQLFSMMPCRHSLAILMIAAVLFGSGGAPAQTRDAREPKPQPAVSAADVAQRIHKLVNAERKKHGLPALVWDGALARIATNHSRDMAHRNYLGHDSPEGHDLIYRYKHAGYKCEVRVGRVIHTGAENVALGRLYNSVTRRNGVATYEWNSPEAIARKTVDGWMNSSGHRENILAPHWKREGIGVEIAPDNRVLVTQNLC
jgi:uncharacterized protein YkwD